MPRRWRWLALAACVAACVFLANLALTEREHDARDAEQAAAVYAASVRTAVGEIQAVAANVPPGATERIVMPVIAATLRSGEPQLRSLAAGTDDPGIAALRRELRTIRIVTAQRLPLASKTRRLTRAANALVAAADGVAARQRERADGRARTAVIGSAVARLLVLLLVATLLRRSHRLAVRAGRKHAEQLRALAEHDPLTGLPNRRRLADDLHLATAEATSAAPVQLLICDLDGFKQLNDTLGHDAGDEHLTQFADRMSAAVAGRATTYRLGGDEFCVMSLPGHDVEDVVRSTAAEATGTGVLRASVGAALLPTEAPTARAAMRLADQRMYAAKAQARALSAA